MNSQSNHLSDSSQPISDLSQPVSKSSKPISKPISKPASKSAARKRSDFFQSLAFLLMKLSAVVVVLALLAIVIDIVLNGWSAINLTFLTQMPIKGMTAGGILPCIVGTIELVILSLLFAVPAGILSAIYLTEYAPDGKAKWVVEQAVNNLAGTPSIVFGLFGMALFIKYIGLPSSILTASLTMGVLILPVIIRTTQESLLSVPKDLRDASYALGVTKWETIRRAVLPSAYSGILTGIILSIGRAAGETAPIMFTGAVYFYPRIPDSVFSPFMALSYHLYVMATESMNIELTRSLQYGTALILLAIVLLMNLTATAIRRHYKKKLA
ncbi:Phosphate transport system permease protein PstA 1 [Methanosarcinaceae archaeon Ag5]|uniref:Phosphate transport system permease protein PstA n=1 Tax=Methanolapillus africanus TaxID=3028297 RepID=A0AAE4MJ22_9EURY|nr:Phosphate transport system permease protein PstA 1 [Methanosarcinaceae archaeon Ag5]